jgi:hypothetical protein
VPVFDLRELLKDLPPGRVGFGAGQLAVKEGGVSFILQVIEPGDGSGHP